MKFLITFFIVLLSFICNANPPTDTIKLKSVEIYFYAWNNSANLRFPIESERELVNKVISLSTNGNKTIVIDTILDLNKLREIDSVCRKNKIIKSELLDTINVYKPIKGWIKDIRLVFILNYSNKIMLIGFEDPNDHIILNGKRFKIKKKLYNYFISVLYDGRRIKGYKPNNN